MCVFLFFIIHFYFIFYFSFLFFSVAVNFLYIFPWRGGEGRWHFVACFLLAHHGTDSVHLFKKKKNAKKQTREVCCMPGNCKREGRGGSCSNVSLLSLSLPRTHMHPPAPPPPRGSPAPPRSARCCAGNPRRRGKPPGAEQPKGCNHVAHTPRGCSVTLHHDAMVFWRTSALS